MKTGTCEVSRRNTRRHKHGRMWWVAVLLRIAWGSVLSSRPTAASSDDGASTLCAAQRSQTSNAWTNGELVAHWQTQASHGSLRLHSVLNRPRLASAIQRSPGVVPKALVVPKERLTVVMNLNAVNAIDEKGRSFEGDGELRLQWYDERLCFNSSLWTATDDADCRCAKPPCSCIFLRGEDLGNYTGWMWVPETAVKSLDLRSGIGGATHSLAHQEQRLTISSDGNITWHRRFVEQFPASFNETKMPFDQQTLSVRIGAFASGSGVPAAETTLQWGGGEKVALTRGDGAEPSLPTGWGICEDGGPTACKRGPPQECDDGSCDLVAYLLITRKFNS